MSFVEPKTFLVGYTHIDKETLFEYLEFSGNSEFINTYLAAEEAGVHPGEIICSVYAKLCYRALTIGQNANVSRTRAVPENIKACFDQGHGSVFEHCQLNFITTNCSRILTHELVRHRAGTAFCLAGDTIVYSGSKTNGHWNGIQKRWTLQQLYRWSVDPEKKSRVAFCSVRVWDGIRFVPAKIKGIICSGVKPIVKITLEDGKTIRCSKDHLFLCNRSSTESWCRVEDLLCGNVLATNGQPMHQDEVWLQKHYHTHKMSQNEMADKAGVSSQTIRKWLRVHNLTDPERSRGHRFASGFVPWNKGLGGSYKLGNIISPEECKRRSKRMSGSGNHRWKGDSASQQAGRLRAIKKYPTQPCEMCGNPNGHRHHKDRNTHNNSTTNIEFLCNSCHGKRHFQEDGPRNNLIIKWVKIRSIEPDGIETTYDIEVDHPSHNFVANGFVTHNSQTSGRYCRPMPSKDVGSVEIDFVHDPILDDVKDIEEEVLEFVARKYTDAVSRLGMSAMKDFDRKKKLTSALRRMLPNGQSNEIGFSCNIRALRHMVMMRTSRHAEWEIRKVFSDVYEIVSKKFPLIFYGAKTEMVDGALEVKGLKMQPYQE